MPRPSRRPSRPRGSPTNWATAGSGSAEHHGMPAVASSAPAVLIGAIADATKRIRVGSGGVMLPNRLVDGRRRAVRNPRRAARRPHRPRARQCAGDRPAHRIHSAAQHRRGDRAMTSPTRSSNCSRSSAASRRSRTVSARSPPRIPASATRPRCGCSARADSARSWPGCSGSRSPSPTTSRAATTRRHAFELYRESFEPSAVLAQPHSMVRVAALVADTEAGCRIGWPCPMACTSAAFDPECGPVASRRSRKPRPTTGRTRSSTSSATATRSRPSAISPRQGAHRVARRSDESRRGHRGSAGPGPRDQTAHADRLGADRRED